MLIQLLPNLPDNILSLWSRFLESAQRDPLSGTIALTNAIIVILMGLLIAQYLLLRKLATLNNQRLDENTKALVDNSNELASARDRSRVWKSSDLFFRNMVRVITRLDSNARSPLYIYRGYDQGKTEPNRELQQAILKAMKDGRISEFHRVAVVTTEASIPITIDWMLPFAIEKALKDKCHFYVAFRQRFNLGSYVALGYDHCFVAIPQLHTDHDIKGPSTTYNGVFVQDGGIAEIIRHYVHNLHEEACLEGPQESIHVVQCTLMHDGWKGTQRQALQEEIGAAFLHFKHKSITGAEAPVSATQTPPTGWEPRLRLQFLRLLRFLHLRSSTGRSD